MKLLVTGGTGFIGSHLAESALASGHEVNVLGLTDNDAERANADLLGSLGARIFPGSITDRDLCDAALEGVTHVYHLAVAMREAGASDAYYRSVNLEGTRRILDLCRQRNVQRFLYCGTIGIFGHRFDGVCNEESAYAPGNIYEETKLAAEELVLGYGPQIGLETLSIRPADVYGPRDERLRKLFVAVSRGRFPLFGAGSGRRHMVFVTDVVSAFERAAVSGQAVGKTFIIAGPEVCTLRELLEQIRTAAGQKRFGFRLPLAPMMAAAAVTEDACRLLGVSPPIYRRRMDFFTSDCAFDTGRARTLLGWRPAVPLREGIAVTLQFCTGG